MAPANKSQSGNIPEALPPSEARKGTLVTDFDGTITRFDFYDLVCREFPEIAGDFWHRYESGELTHFEALRQIFAGIRAPRERLLEILQEMQIDPQFEEAVTKLQQHGWEVTVASAGCLWYIELLLPHLKDRITIHANPGSYAPATGLSLQPPLSSPFFSPDLGINKVAVVRAALKENTLTAFAGDGRPDLASALLVPPSRRFARNWLAKKLHEIGEEYQPFERWSEIANFLVKE